MLLRQVKREIISARKLTIPAICLFALFTLGIPSETIAPAQTPLRPNIVVIMTDDQNLEDMRVMTKTLDLIGSRGTTFTNFFTSFPLCCPSRTTLITGQYSHNHEVESNIPPNGGYGKLDHSNTLPVWLQAAGYRTIHIGKWLNGYGIDNPDPEEVPPGWSDWQGLVDPSTYQMYGYTVNNNGTLVTYGDAEEDYQTDVLADRAVAAINREAGRARPFFLSIGTLAPHGESNLPNQPPPRAAPRHQGAFASEPLPMPPSFNEANMSDKPSFVRNLPLFSADTIETITAFYRGRLGSLLAVDDLVERVVNALEATGQMDDTVIFFMSDNGFLLGQHRIRTGKIWGYEESARVPLMIRGGGFPAGAAAEQNVANIDIAPTIVELAGASATRVMDGRSLLPLALEPGLGKDRRLLIETGSNNVKNLGINLKYKAIRTEQYLYVEHRITDEQELYDMRIDPFQLQSRHADPDYRTIKSDLAARLDRLSNCAGSICSQGSTEPTPSPRPMSDISIAETDFPDPVTVGSNFSYTINVANNGPNNATRVTLTDTLPSGVVFVSASPGCNRSDSLITCSFSGLDRGDDAVVRIVVAPTTVGTITNVAEVTAREFDPDETNNRAAEDTTVNPVRCAGFTATIVGTSGNDVLTGTDGRDVIHSLGGSDTINGLGGDDIICGGAGNDSINGGNSADRIFGQGGSDTLSGNTGNDTLNGGNGNDRLNGGFGGDTLNGDAGSDTLNGGFGNDRLNGGFGGDTLNGEVGFDTLRGGPGGDALNGSFGDDSLDGGTTTDTCDGGAHISRDTAVNCETVVNIP